MPSGKSRSKEDTWKEADLKKALQGDDKKRSKSDRREKERSKDGDRRERRDRDDERRRELRGEARVGSGEAERRRDKEKRRKENGDKERRHDRDRDRERRHDRGDKDSDKRDLDRERRHDQDKDKERAERRERERRDRDGDRDRRRERERDKDRQDKEQVKEKVHRSRDEEGREERRKHRDKKERDHEDKDGRKREKDERGDRRKRRDEENDSRERKHREKSGDRRKDQSREREDKDRKDRPKEKDDRDRRKHREGDQEVKAKDREREMLASLKKEEDSKSKSKLSNGQRFRADTLEEADAVEEDVKPKPHPSVTRAGSSVTEIHEEEGAAGYDYDDEDFEDYDEDFEEDNEEEENEAQDHHGMQELLQAINAENELALSREGSKLSKSSEDDSKQDSITRPVTAKGRINFVVAKQKQISEKVASRTRKRGQELMHLIDLDVTAFEMFDLPPMNEYELYIKNFGRSDTKQAYVQCNDDNVDRDIQTEEIELRTKWTQQPPEGYGACGDEREELADAELPTFQNRTHIDSVRLSHFLKKAGQACLVLLEEALVEQTKTNFKDNKSMACSDGFIQLATKQPLFKGRQVQCVHMSSVQTHLLLTAYSPSADQSTDQSSKMVATKGLVCLWNINEPSIPQKMLVCESVPRCCCLSPSKATLAFAGLEDGSVVAWDLRESSSLHHLYRLGDQDFILRSPTFSTAGVLAQDNHHSPVVSLLPVVMPGDSMRASSGGGLMSDDMLGLSFQLATLEQNALIHIWVVVELEASDIAGSESDLGLAPGGKIKLIQSSSLVLESPNRDAQKTVNFQTLTMQLLPQDPNHYYIATDGGFVLHRDRHGGRSPPKAYRPEIECLVDIATLDVSPWQLPCLLTGSKDGVLQLYNLKNEFPLSSWTHSTKGSAICTVRWSRSRPSVFFVLDADSRLHIWDLLEKDSGPVAVEKLKREKVVLFELSSDYSASGIGMPGRSPELVLVFESGALEVHRISAKFSTSSPDELDSNSAYSLYDSPVDLYDGPEHPIQYFICEAKYRQDVNRERRQRSFRTFPDPILNSLDLHQRLSVWDRDLQSPSPPTYPSLIDFLCRRLLPCSALTIVRKLVRLVMRGVLYFIGLPSAHERIVNEHQTGAPSSVWYCPAHADDRFGLWPDDTYFQSASLPSQVQMSYSIIIRGKRGDPGTSILDGLADFTHMQEADYSEVDGGRNNSTGEACHSPDLESNESSHCSLTETSNPMVCRAASLILAILKVRDYYSSAEFSPDKYKGTQPQTMLWYAYFFSTCLQFHRDFVERHVTAREYSDHVIVMSRGRMFKVELMRRNGMGEEVMPTYQEIKRQLERVVQASHDTSSELYIGALTTLSAADRFQEEQILKSSSNRNRYNLAATRDSLFVVSLDEDDFPRLADDALYSVQSNNPVNRWYDKSINLVVFGNGVAGFLLNYLTGMTGTVAGAFVHKVVEIEEELLEALQENKLACHDQIQLKELRAPSLLLWEDTSDSYFQKKTTSLLHFREVTGPFAPCRPAMFKLSPGLTRTRLVESRVSPAGSFNAALQLALLRMRGTCMSVFEIISIRHFLHGGLAWLETNTADMKHFVTIAREHVAASEPPSKTNNKHLKELLIQAIQSYRDELIRSKNGEIQLWHLDALYRVMGLCTRLPRPREWKSNLRILIQQPVVDYLRSLGFLPPAAPDNFISNPSWNPAIEAVGRVGVKCLLPKGGMALHYLMSRDRIAITVSTSPNHPCHGKEREFARLLDDSMGFIQQIIDS